MKKILLMLFALIPLTAAAQPAVLDGAYYNKLRQSCRNNSNSFLSDNNCCLASVDSMQERKAFQLDKALTVECPAGYSKNMLKCESTYQWCEPMDIKVEPKVETK